MIKSPSGPPQPAAFGKTPFNHPVAGPGLADRDPTQLAALMNTGQALVRSLAWKTHAGLPPSVELDDLIAYGQVGLAEAARDYDDSRGASFITFAYYRVRGAILDGLSTMSWFSKHDYYMGRYAAAANDVLSQDEADAAGDDLDWFIRGTRSLCVAYVLSNAEPEGQTFDPADDSEGELDRVELADSLDLMRDHVRHLDHQERTLIETVYFEGQTIKAAGESLGISKAWASRLHKRALDQLSIRLADSCGYDRPVEDDDPAAAESFPRHREPALA